MLLSTVVRIRRIVRAAVRHLQVQLEGIEEGIDKVEEARGCGYKGTARPLPEANYKGTMNRSNPAVPSVRKKNIDDRADNRAAAPLLPVQYPSHVMRTTLTKLTEKRKTKWTMSQTYPIWRLAHLTLKKRQMSSKVARKEDDEELRKELELKKRKRL
jgi:hypothetical protein